jgi:hypothetical protein
MQEGRPPPAFEQELDRRGWASLLVRERSSARPHEASLTGSTETCWNPVQRLHSGCAVWGDYVRPPGWIVRIFDPDATSGQSCQWSLVGGVIAETDPRQFVGATQRALQAGTTTVVGDCREVRIVVPSVPAEAKTVAGQVTVMRTSPNGSPVSVTITPKDRLVIGFGDSFTSGEGNPERLAIFSGKPWTGGNLPDRAPDPVSLATKDTRAQWTDRWCHRSVYSWRIRTALDAALNDPHQSFTILPYGCSGAPWCGRTDAPTPQQEQARGFYAAAAPALRRAAMRCGLTNIFKRSADALIDIGINDVGFASWAAGIILQDPFLRSAASAMTPCFDGTARCAATRELFTRLDSRYGLLRTVLDQYMLPDLGIDPSHVIVAVYPPALENETGVFCPQGNAGLTIGTLPSLLEAHCGGSFRARRRARAIS